MYGAVASLVLAVVKRRGVNWLKLAPEKLTLINVFRVSPAMNSQKCFLMKICHGLVSG